MKTKTMMMEADHQQAGPSNIQKDQQVVSDLLSHFFKHVMPFPVYLAQIFPNMDSRQIQNIFSSNSKQNANLSSKLMSLHDAIIAYNLDHIPFFQDPNLDCQSERDDEWLYETLKELITRAQATILRNQETSFSSNMLTLGYRKADDRSTVMSMAGSICISNIHVNACVTQILMGEEWSVLLQAIGEIAMEHILTHTALFVPLNAPAQSNLVQILGQSIGEMKELSRSLMNVESENPPRLHRKRKRRQSSQKVNEKTMKRRKSDLSTQPQRTPAEIDLLRNRIFYAKLSRMRMGGIVRGFPVNHVLQRSFSDRILIKPSLKSPDHHTLLEARARLLCKHIWPREHGLKHVFCNKNIQNGTKQEYEMRMSLSSREEELRIRGKIRTPKRLLNCKKLLKLIILKHDRFDYRRALELCCPTSLPKRNLTQAEREELVEELSESVVRGKVETQANHKSFSETQFETQANRNSFMETQFETQCHDIGMDSDEDDLVKEKLYPETKLTQKPRYTKYKTPHGCVARFVRHVLRSIIPIEVFGSVHNRDIVFKTCDHFIGLRRYESINLHQITQGFRILDCEWLLPRDEVARNQRPTKEESTKRQDLINELLFWLFDGILMPLLRTNFYATESAKFRNHVLYFRGDVWSKITEPIIENLKDERFEKIGKHKAVGIMSRRSFGYSFVRLLPKEVGMRPIVNLRRRSTKIDRKVKAAVTSKSRTRKTKSQSDEWGQLVVQNHSINNIMNATFQVLNFERQDNPNALGSSVFGPHDVFLRLSNFKAQLQSRYGEQLPQLYFVKMDIAGAFDCIDQTKLLKIVEGIVRYDRYIVQRYNKLTSSNGQPLRSWPKVACAEEEHEPFQILAQHLAHMQAWRNTILADSVTYPQCDRKSLIWLLSEHINNNLIKVGKDFCRQRVGIPQGSTLSTLLCCYYLARMESDLDLNDGSGEENKRESLLMRYTDDFIFISPDKELARQFFVSVHQGSSDFNCSIAAEKTEFNFRMYDASMEDDLATVALAVQVRSNASSSCGQEDTSFPWCSYRIDTETLSVRYDLERYRNTCVADSLTVPNRKPFSTLLSHMIGQSVQRQNLPIYLDVSLNSLGGVLRNIHQMFFVATIKFISAYQELKKRDMTNKSKVRGDKFIHDSILANIEHAYAHACAKMNQIRLQQQQKQSSSSVSVDWYFPLLAYRWTALHSIIYVLEIRPSTQKMAVTQSLKNEIRKVTIQIDKQVRRDKSPSPLLNKRYLFEQVSKSLKQAKPILRSLKMQR